MAKAKFNTIGKATRSHTSRGWNIQQNVLQAGKQAIRKAEEEKKRLQQIKAMTYDDREDVAQMDFDDDNDFAAYEAPFDSIPPGDEGFGISHEGGEYEIFEEFADELEHLTGIRRTDTRDRADRIGLRISHWDAQIEKLVDAYLLYKMRADREDEPFQEPLEEDSSELFGMKVLDIFYWRRRKFVLNTDDVFHNVSLVRNGCIGSAPLQPSMAFSIRTLAVYRQTHRVCPCLSIQAEVRKLCHLHDVPFQPSHTEQFSVAYDIYLEILSRVDRRVNAALKHDAPNWRLLNSCPACFYKLKGERSHKFSFMCEMDGNNSLKRTDATLRGVKERDDQRTGRRDYWLTSDYVDRFKDEVKARKKGKSKEEDYEDDWEDESSEANGAETCIERWRNAGPEQRKKMFAMYDESGIFLCACRHGLVLLVCDMIRSGELAKYPLAIVSNSSRGRQAEELKFRLVVGSFHGHAHNRLCQIDFHPNNVEGMGRANAEGCERIFSFSNHLASGTRHANKFHRWQAIEEHFGFWDNDKYANLSAFFHNHIREAMNIVNTWKIKFVEIRESLRLKDEDFYLYIQEERAYLRGLKGDIPEDKLRLEYAEALDDLYAREQAWDAARMTVNKLLNKPATSNIGDQLFLANGRVKAEYKKMSNALSEVERLETQLGYVGNRWTMDCEEYKAARERLAEGKFRKILDELERLVVQRLFELGKLNISGTGYKMRMHIAKALNRRSDAIRNALQRYNTIAAKLKPPRPQLDWKQIVDYGFLSKFELLKHSRPLLLSKPWAQPLHRQATVEYFRYIRAKEEIERINVEMRRLRTSIQDERIEIGQEVEDLKGRDLPLCEEIQRRWRLRAAVQAIHIKRLDKIESLPGFSGIRGMGIAVNKEPAPSNATKANQLNQPVVSNEAVDNVLNSEAGQDSIVDKEVIEQDLEGMAMFMERIE